LVEFIDIYPTLADVCGLPKPKDVEGVSLKPLLDDPTAHVRPVAISQYPRGDAGVSLMGYSIRDDRWRLTLWRNRADNSIHATELYDEVNDPHETANVAKQPEHAEVIARLSKHLPPPIAAAQTPSPAGKAPAAKPAATDRATMFERRDTNKDGKLTKEEFMAKQRDPEQAAKNFPRFDKDRNGELSQEEFVKMGQ
jgi:hypothetical protein